ncbi:MAG: N-acetylmuramoyl-L-alanine amidase [Chloroflexi bacterium]|nr:N-acetylmuramoyl-L-alanine amidase [Chloroflexota bacterium]
MSGEPRKQGRSLTFFPALLPQIHFHTTPLIITLATIAVLTVAGLSVLASPLRHPAPKVAQQDSQASVSLEQSAGPSSDRQDGEPGPQKQALAGIKDSGLNAAVPHDASLKPRAEGEDRSVQEQQTSPAQQGPEESLSQPEPIASSAPRGDKEPALEPRGGARPAQGRVVVIDPGHGGSDAGATRTFADRYVMKESDLALKVGLSVAAQLEAEGVQAILTRDTDAPVNNSSRAGYAGTGTGGELQARVDIANNAEADLFVSVHFNSAASAAGGTEVFYCPDHPFADKSKKMAQLLQDNIRGAMQALGYDPPNRGVKVDTQSAAGTHLYVLGPKTGTIARPIAVPSVLGEALFISNEKEGDLLRDGKTLEALAGAYTNAVLQYFDWLSL